MAMASAITVSPFKPHMSIEDAKKLTIGQNIDFRGPTGNGMFYPGIIIEKDDSARTIKIQADVLGVFYQGTLSYEKDYKCIAECGSICKRPAHRLKDITIDSFVDVKTNNLNRWVKGKVLGVHGGQINVLLELPSSQMTKVVIHVDNVNQVDRFGIHTQERFINHVPIVLETKRAHINTPNEMKTECAQTIIDNVYGGMDNVLSYLINNNATTTHLIEIKNIIKQKNVEYNEKIKQAQAVDVSKSENILKICFSKFPEDLIEYICGFLDRHDIKSFKLTSFAHGIICLNEMTKCNISMFNTNELIDDVHQKYVDKCGFGNICQSNLTYQRLPANWTYSALQNIFEEKYNIPPYEQAALGNDHHFIKGNLRVLDTRHHPQFGKFQLKVLKKKCFILFDKRNMIQFDSETNKPSIVKVMNPKKHKVITILKWFDVYFQEIITLQFVVGNVVVMTIGRLEKYVEKEFI
eukprot:13165_1